MPRIVEKHFYLVALIVLDVIAALSGTLITPHLTVGIQRGKSAFNIDLSIR